MAFYDAHTHVNERLGQADVISIYNYMTFQSNAISSYPNFDNVFLSLGIHPWYVDENLIDLQLEILETELQNNKKIVAIGECGLDKLSGCIDLQETIFLAQIKLANTYQLPIIIHCVKAWDLLIKIVRQKIIEVPCIIHGFRGNQILLQQLLKYDFYFSLGSKYNQAILSVLPISKLLLETDDSNDPIQNIYRKISKDLKMQEEELVFQIEQNVNIFPFY